MKYALGYSEIKAIERQEKIDTVVAIAVLVGVIIITGFQPVA